MKRLIYSILGGLIFPFVYILIGISLAQMFPQYFSETMYVFGSPAPGLIFAPIGVPFWVYNIIQYHRYLGLPFIFNTVWFRAIFTIGFNIALHASLTYAVLWYFGIFKRKTIQTSETPPPPPTQF
jgi:hypothetical protein